MDVLKCREDYEPFKVVSGGALCEFCGDRIEDWEIAYTEAVPQVANFPQRLYCTPCTPSEEGLPEGVQSLEAGFCIETSHEDGEFLGFAVEPGSACSVCDHYFEEGEWMQVGVQERIAGAEIICQECFQKLPGEFDMEV
jgi:hypothetical protein